MQADDALIWAEIEQFGEVQVLAVGRVLATRSRLHNAPFYAPERQEFGNPFQRCPANAARRPASTRSPEAHLERRAPRAAQLAESRMAPAMRCRPHQRAIRGSEGTF